MTFEAGRRIAVGTVRSFARHDLLSNASAMAFQTLFALVPAALAGIALLGYLNLEEIWEEDVGPEIRDRVQDDAWSVVERTVDSILGERKALWLTFGLAFALWQISGAVRATMGPLNVIYQDEEDRPLWKRFGVSVLLAPLLLLLVGFAIAAVQFGGAVVRAVPVVPDWAVTLGRWPLAALALGASVWLLLRFAPAKRESSWVTVGALFVLAAWLASSVVFGLYTTYVADYASVFGSLASVVVLMTYLYVSAVVFLVGAQIDACVRAERDSKRSSA